MTDEQEADKVVWTPSKMIERLGREIDNEESIYYWCAKVGVCGLYFFSAVSGDHPLPPPLRVHPPNILFENSRRFSKISGLEKAMAILPSLPLDQLGGKGASSSVLCPSRS